MATTLTKQQEEQLKKRGLTSEKIEEQLSMFKQGTKYMNLARPARLVDGIMHLTEEEHNAYVLEYESVYQSKDISKFIPASGAATRMFKNLYAYLDNEKMTPFVETFFTDIEKFAFYTELKSVLEANQLNLESLISDKDYKTILEYLLNEKGLSYGQLPKGLLAFHKSDNKINTPIVEHIKEAKAYAGDKAQLIFTISEEYKERFVKEIDRALKDEDAETMSYQITYQKPETDTIAVDTSYNPVTIDSGDVLVRPGGHGSLIANLNEVDSDIVFIKNIDNVCADQYLETTIEHKKVLAGILLNLQKKVFDLLKKLEGYDGQDDQFNFEVRDFLEQELGVLSKKLCRMEPQEKADYFIKLLDRPLRVCGMVRNVGEPGGGPFWVRSEPWLLNLQIVESSQINFEDKVQKMMFEESSHFNPVDIVCAVRDSKGQKFDLEQFVDKEAVFIAEKSHQGKDILALEHPGLWNGGMSHWNTVFVEVPIETFNPVKTINDLLRKEHQN